VVRRSYLVRLLVHLVVRRSYLVRLLVHLVVRQIPSLR
jgi:hypothetical protein